MPTWSRRCQGHPDQRTKNLYFPTFGKVLKSHGQDFLVGSRLSRADIHLVELLCYVQERDPSLLVHFPLLKALETIINHLPTVKNLLQCGRGSLPWMRTI